MLLRTVQIGGSKLIKETNNTQNELRDLKDYAGMIRYNATTGKIEGFNGTKWVQFH
ncbi:hypothetical protein FHS04_000858 [Mesoflavibacter sabulilitoris]|uniref:hypothetical protein n=1 Tax=Mesoflavibacter zeaxanthinifaciens TaxID=393060 RepID=UPI0015E6B75E|nr:hypothetical protein [Mesoflavibacter zeaxanthinifaciens]MBB3123361.1 hypothetical protein [Mesoflavibacter zeaxanthinifaciens subsp. sabulilitoris]